MALKDDEKIRFAGDVSIDKIEVISANGFGQEITNQVAAIEIYEDLFSPFTSGVIAVKETLDFINLFPLVGEEYVNIRVRTPSFTKVDMIIDDQFVIYKVSERIQTGDRNMVYALHFISREALVDTNKKISRSYSGKISDIVQDIVENKNYGLESSKRTNIEQTISATKFVSNYWSPVTSINYVAERATSVGYHPNYIFFENRNGFNFMSLNKLYTSATKQTFVSDAFMREINPDGTSMRDVEEEYKRIIDINIPVVYDYLERASSGMYGSKKISYDILSKKYSVKNFDMRDSYDEHDHLNKHSPVSSKAVIRPDQLVLNSKYYYGNFNGYGDVTQNSSIQTRLSLMKQAEATKVEITVPGRTDYTVGDKVNLILNKFNTIKRTDTDDDVIDNMFSGNYLISSINHSIDREKHECVMELIKDSFIVDLEKGGE